MSRAPRTGRRVAPPVTQFMGWVEKKKTTRGVALKRVAVKSSASSTPQGSPSKKSRTNMPHHTETFMDDAAFDTEQLLLPHHSVSLPLGKPSKDSFAHRLHVQTQNDYLREWLPRRQEYLARILDSEAPPDPRQCTVCTLGDGTWKCLDCLGHPVMCIGCCRSTHQRHPFHRVEQWTGTHFAASWLRQVGLTVNLGHGGHQCPRQDPGETAAGTSKTAPTAEPTAELAELMFTSGINEDEDNVDDNGRPASGTAGLLDNAPPPAAPRDNSGNRYLIFVDRSGVHKLAVHWCQCSNAAEQDIQLLDMGFFPASFRRVRTVFTFAVLDDFLVDNLECKTSASSYYTKIRHITSKVFPHTVPVSNFPVCLVTIFSSQGLGRNF